MHAAIVLLAVVLLSTEICYWIAKKRGASVSFWVCMGAVFGPFAVPFVFFAKPRRNTLLASGKTKQGT